MTSAIPWWPRPSCRSRSIPSSIAPWRRLSAGWQSGGRRRRFTTSPSRAFSTLFQAPRRRDRLRACRSHGLATAARKTTSRPTVVDLNIETIQALRAEGRAAIYGDASQRETLVSAGRAERRLDHPERGGLPGANEVIRTARELNPSILILARTAYIRELVALKSAGANVVYAGESEVALAFTETILGRLGATAEQIDRERARVHEEILAQA